MNGLMMNYQLTLNALLERAEKLFGHKEIVSRLPDKSFHRYTYADFVRNTKKLTLALQKLGVQSGDRVATFCWNHHQHLEAYFAIPAANAVLHTLNLRLSPDDLTYIMNHAEDKVLIIDKIVWPLFEKFRERVNPSAIIVVSEDGSVPEGTHNYQTLLDEIDESAFEYPKVDENQAAAICYTSGTTGRPKGVMYSHRSLVLHSFGAALPDVMGMSETDVALPVVPMFHANAWGIPYTATMVGCKQVYPGPHLDGVSLLEDFQQEKVTMTGGVPTIWLGIIGELEKNPDRWQLTPGMRMVVGGSAAPESLIRRFDKFNLKVFHAWGMTEMAPLGTFCRLNAEALDAPEDQQYARRATQGRPSPFVEMRGRGDEGFIAWDGKTMGELEVRGPWVAAAYFNSPGSEDRFTDDGWFKTGDIVTIDELGYMRIADRTKDLIKSGGEWISSVDLENALMGHPAVAEAAVIAVPHPKWDERPLAVVVLREGEQATPEDLSNYLLSNSFAKWWLPDDYAFIDTIPRNATGKFLKSALRQRFPSFETVSN